MDKLGERIVKDRADIHIKRVLADRLEDQARKIRREADEMERLLELARLER